MKTRKALKHLPDQLLVEGFLNGDSSFFDELYERYKGQVYGYLYKILSDQPSVVDDIFQQTWLKVIKQLGKYKNKQKFLAWVIRIAHNSSIDYFRKAKKYTELPLEEEIINSNPTNRPWQKMDKKELATALEDAISKLSNEQKEVFIMRQDEISFKDIAKIQNASINTVIARMQYALRNLQNNLSSWYERR